MNEIKSLITRYPCLEKKQSEILNVFNAMLCSVKSGNKIMVCGNGGSAADSEHIVGELMKEFKIKRKLSNSAIELLTASDGNSEDLLDKLQGAIPAISLNSQTALMTAILNDCDPSMVFAQQVFGIGKAGDILIALSTSGNSKNILNAVRVARALNIKTILISGGNGGAIHKITDFSIILPERETYKVQELTLPVYHTICAMLESEMF